LDFFTLAFIVVLNAALSGLVAYAAKSRSRSASAFFWLSFFASFFIGILVLIALPSGVKQVDGLRFACPHCDEQASRNAKICPHCRLNVGTHFQKLKAQEEKDLAERKRALQAQSMAESRRAEAEALVRKKLTRKVLKNPFTWLAAGSLVIGIATAIYFQIMEQERVAKLLSPDCGVIQESIDVSFDGSVAVKFSLPDECGENLGLAVEQGVVDTPTARGKIQMSVFFDEKPVEKLSVWQSFTTNDYSIRIPNELFWRHPIDHKKIAETIRVELTYESGLLLPQTAVHSIPIPKTPPEVRFVADGLRTSKSKGTYYVFAFLNYTTYQVADSIEFDWPGIDEDEIKRTPGSVKEYLQGYIASTYTSESSASANVVIKVVQNGKVVQTLIASTD
jgi:hypothetical protein